jgi:hypothetical protein
MPDEIVEPEVEAVAETPVEEVKEAVVEESVPVAPSEEVVGGGSVTPPHDVD